MGTVARSFVRWVSQIYKSSVSCVQHGWVGSRVRERGMFVIYGIGGMWLVCNYIELVELYWRGNCNRGKNSCSIFRWLITIKQNLFNTNFVSAIKQSIAMTIKLRAVWVQIAVQLEFCCAACTLTGLTARTFLFLNFCSIIVELWERHKFRQWHGKAD
jgi:hypothetical protein